MKYLSDRYVSVYTYKGLDICTLKVAVPTEGDQLNYLIDNEIFNGQVFDDIASAIAAIDSLAEKRDMKT